MYSPLAGPGDLLFLAQKKVTKEKGASVRQGESGTGFVSGSVPDSPFPALLATTRRLRNSRGVVDPAKASGGEPVWYRPRHRGSLSPRRNPAPWLRLLRGSQGPQKQPTSSLDSYYLRHQYSILLEIISFLPYTVGERRSE